MVPFLGPFETGKFDHHHSWRWLPIHLFLLSCTDNEFVAEFFNGSRDFRCVIGVLNSVLEVDLRDHVFSGRKPYPFLDHVFGFDITDVAAAALYAFDGELQQSQICHGYVGVFGQWHIIQETNQGA